MDAARGGRERTGVHRRGHFAAQLGVAGLAGTFQNWQNEILPFLREASDELAALL